MSAIGKLELAPHSHTAFVPGLAGIADAKTELAVRYDTIYLINISAAAECEADCLTLFGHIAVARIEVLGRGCLTIVRSIGVAGSVVAAVHAIDGIGIEHTTCIDVHDGRVVVVDEEVGRHIVFASPVACAIAAGTVEGRSLQLVDAVGNVSHDVLRNSEGCVPSTGNRIDVGETGIGTEVVTAGAFVGPLGFPILEVAVLVEGSILDDVADVGAFADAGHDGILEQRPGKGNLCRQFLLAQSTSIDDILIGTIRQFFVCFIVVLEVLVEQVGCSTVQVVATGTLFCKSCDGLLISLISEVATADKVGRAGQHISNSHNLFEGRSVLDGILGLIVGLHESNLRLELVEFLLDSCNLLLADEFDIAISQLVEAPAVPNGPVAIEVEAVLDTDVDAVLRILNSEVERLVPIESASKVLVAGCQRVGNPHTCIVVEVLGLAYAGFLSILCDIHEAVGNLLAIDLCEVLAAVIERSVFFAEFTSFVCCTRVVAPLLSTSQALQTQAVDTGLQALDGLIGLEPMRVPVLCHAVVDSQAAAVAGVDSGVAVGRIMVGISKDFEEGEVGVLLVTDLAETVYKLVVRYVRTGCVRVGYIIGHEGAVATQITICIYLHMAGQEGGELVLSECLIPCYLFLIAVEHVAELSALYSVIINDGSLKRRAIDAVAVVEGGAVEAGQVLLVVLDATYGSA